MCHSDLDQKFVILGGSDGSLYVDVQCIYVQEHFSSLPFNVALLWFCVKVYQWVKASLIYAMLDLLLNYKSNHSIVHIHKHCHRPRGHRQCGHIPHGHRQCGHRPHGHRQCGH